MIYHQPGNSRGNFHYNIYTYSGREYAPHFHKNMELICVESGAMTLTVNGSCSTVEAGQWALVLSNQIHSFLVPESAVAWVTVFSEEYVPAFTAKIKGKQGSRAVFTPGQEVALLLKKHLMDGSCSRMMRKACFYAVCDEFLRCVPLENRQEKGSFLVGQLLDWIAGHYTEDISLKQAAQLLGYEYHYLSRLLSRSFAISFTQLLAGYRVEHALHLLQDTDLPVTRIAELSGFQSIRSFNLIVKKHTGKTPVEHRSPD